MYRKLTTVAAVAALAFGLAACGGGGSSPTTDNQDQDQNQQDDMMPPAPTPVAVTVPDAMYLDADNMPTAGSMTIAAGMTGTSGGVTFLCAEGGEACEVTVADDGSVTATGGTVTASLTAAAMTQVAEAKDAKAGEENLARLMRRDRAIGKSRALEGHPTSRRRPTLPALWKRTTSSFREARAHQPLSGLGTPQAMSDRTKRSWQTAIGPEGA